MGNNHLFFFSADVELLISSRDTGFLIYSGGDGKTKNSSDSELLLNSVDNRKTINSSGTEFLLYSSDVELLINREKLMN